jgi:ribosomal protein L29
MAKKISELNDKEKEEKLKELKIELLKQPTKRRRIKREIARVITLKLNNDGGKKK